jgi:glycosyltransferase involved in cell wall biosynthesis
MTKSSLTSPPSGAVPRAGGRRVCMLVYSFYESDNRVLRYARALVERGDIVDVIALGSGDDQPDFEVIDRVNVFRIQRRTRNEKGKFSYLYRLAKFCLKSFVFLSRMQLKHKYDLVHVHNVPDFLVFSALLPKLGGARIILDIHDILPEFFANKFRKSENNLYVSMLRLAESASTRFADHVIISNHLWRDKITQRSVPRDKCAVFINHVDVSVFNRERTRKGGPFIILYHGGLQRHQGLDLAINAFARIREQTPETEFHIYGGGNVKPELQALVKSLGLEEKVRFFESVTMREIAGVVANADLGIVPKRADSFGNEAFSTKIMEYMAEGVPVIVSKTKVDTYYFNDSIVRFFESGNEQKLAEAMLALVTSPELRSKLAGNAREFVALNSWDVKKHEYLHLVDSLLNVPRVQPVAVTQNP